jgi:NADH-quinone oxidoreductase subunit E
MPSLTHILETTLLVLLAYLLGCSIGYLVHRVLYAARGTRQVPAATIPVSLTPTSAAPRARRTMTPAARLASAVSDDPVSRNAPAQSSRAEPATPARSAAGPRPDAMGRPRAGGADDLKRIKGIGPKLEAALNALGVYHLDQVASWSAANVDWVDGQLALKGRITRERWVEQAKAIVTVTRLSA